MDLLASEVDSIVEIIKNLDTEDERAAREKIYILRENEELLRKILGERYAWADARLSLCESQLRKQRKRSRTLEDAREEIFPGEGADNTTRPGVPVGSARPCARCFQFTSRGKWEYTNSFGWGICKDCATMPLEERGRTGRFVDAAAMLYWHARYDYSQLSTSSVDYLMGIIEEETQQ